LELKLSFTLEALSLRITSFQLISGSHAVHLAGSLFLLGGLVDLAGNVNNSSVNIRSVGTIQEPNWELISPKAK
jgi:hypothetical protein